MKDEEDSLGQLWTSIRAQTHPPDQIVFVHAGSSDRTGEILEQCELADARVRVIPMPGAYPGTARNAGIEAAEHPVVALADCGTVFSPDWLEELVRAFGAPEHCDVAYGTFEPIRDGPVARWSDIAFLPPVRDREGGLRRGETLRSLLLTREIWARVGRFPPWRAAEDLDFLRQLRAPGIERAFAPRAVAYWRPPATVGDTFRKLTFYSCHNVWAGKQRDWHHGVARAYGAAVGVGILASVATGHRPSRTVSVSLFTSVTARTAARLWRARRTDAPLRAVRTGDALGVALMILVGDVATLAGWAAALTHRPPSAYR